jgi:methylmalonyl-CoA/ethylmalonyl-CoA epimerase
MKRLDHVAICVRDLEAALRVWRDGLGLELLGIEEIPARQVRVAMLRAGDTRIELVQPTSDTSEVSRFLERRGEGLHHVAFAVDDVGAALETATDAGAIAVPGAGRAGAGGTRVAFLNPRSVNGVLVELVAAGPSGEPSRKE